MKLLVTGGAGYIGSHTVLELLSAGHDVTIVDNLCNSKLSVLDRIETITQRRPDFFPIDVRDQRALEQVLCKGDFDAVLHFAGLKSVADSVRHPYEYYDNNVSGSLALFGAMLSCGPSTIIFSSSAAVYGESDVMPIREDVPQRPSHPYGRSKLMIEDALRDLARTDGSSWRIGLLRYFNPVGAHFSGMLGEAPSGPPNNLVPTVAGVAAGTRSELTVFGGDYATPDGTGVRDYIHVVDVAKGHLAALNALSVGAHRAFTVNLGTGRGYSVLEVIRAFERASKTRIPYRLDARRPGDVARCFADPSLALSLLGWRAEHDLHDMCSDAWRWQQWGMANGLL